MSSQSINQYAAELLPGFEPEIGCWLWALEDTRRRTKKVLTGLDQSELDWIDPHSGLSVSTLLYHIAAIEVDWLYSDILGGVDFPWEIDTMFMYDVRDSNGNLSIVESESIEVHIERLDLVRRFFLAAFYSMPVSEFRRCRYVDDYKVTPEWVIHHLMQHEAEHRGLIAEMRKSAERQVSA